MRREKGELIVYNRESERVCVYVSEADYRWHNCFVFAIALTTCSRHLREKERQEERWIRKRGNACMHLCRCFAHMHYQHLNTHTHTYTHTCAYTHTHTHTHTHTETVLECHGQKSGRRAHRQAGSINSHTNKRKKRKKSEYLREREE